MASRSLYGFEIQGLGAGMELTQKALLKLGLQLHESFPLPGGRFLFLGFSGESQAPEDQFRALCEKTLILKEPHQELIDGLLHLQAPPSISSSALVLESSSPLDLIASVQSHLEQGEVQLYELQFRGLGGYALALLSWSGEKSALGGKLFNGVIRTPLKELAPDWRREYFV